MAPRARGGREAVTTLCDWTLPQNDALWQNGVKTLFDPCPVGWRVPLSGSLASGLCPWSGFRLADVTVNEPWDTDVAGFCWGEKQAYGGTVWYAASGARYDNSRLYVVGHSGYCWSSSAGRYYLGLDFGTITPDRNTAAGSYGFPVRCIRE